MTNDNDARILPLTVVIPTLNRPSVLLATVQSYYAGEFVPAEIIVVDQSAAVTRLGEIEVPPGAGLRVIRIDEPSSTRSRNVGARASRYDVILFSDDDVLINDESMCILMEQMRDKTIALVAGVDISDNGIYGPSHISGPAQNFAGVLLGLKKPWKKTGYIVKSNMRGRYPSPVCKVVSTEWAMGYFMCVRRSLMEHWNIWFDEHLQRYAYAEDLDFSMRYCSAAAKDGLRTLLDPNIYVYHLASKEWRTPSDEAVQYFVNNRRYLSKKLFPKRWWYRIAMRWFDTLFALSCAPRDVAYLKQLLRAVWWLAPGD